MTPDQLLKAYSIEAPPESVAKLASLVAKREENVGEIVKLISAEESLKARLFRAAAPRARHGVGEVVDMSVEDAILRAGMGCVLLLAMADPVIKAVHKTFSSMLQIQLETVDAGAAGILEGNQVVGIIRFSGNANGAVYLRTRREFACRVVAGMLGITEEEANDVEMMRDTYGEVCNMVVGNFKSNLCDAGLDCVLTPPEVHQVDAFEVEQIPGAGYDLLAFQNGNDFVWLDMNVRPFE